MTITNHHLELTVLFHETDFSRARSLNFLSWTSQNTIQCLLPIRRGKKKVLVVWRKVSKDELINQLVLTQLGIFLSELCCRLLPSQEAVGGQRHQLLGDRPTGFQNFQQTTLRIEFPVDDSRSVFWLSIVRDYFLPRPKCWVW